MVSVLFDELGLWVEQLAISWRLLRYRYQQQLRIRIYETLEAYVGQLGSVTAAMEMLYERRRRHGDQSAVVYADLLTLIKQQNLDPVDAFRRVFPADEVVFLEVAKQTGRIHEGFARACRVAKLKSEVRATLLGALSYPIFLMLVTFVTTYLLLSIQFPLYAKTLDPAAWTGAAAGYRELHDLIVLKPWLMPLGMIVVLVFVQVTLRMERGVIRQFLDILPPWRLQKRLQSSVFLISMANMMQQGYTLTQCLEALSEWAPRYLASHLRDVRSKLLANVQQDDIWDVGLFQAETLWFLQDFVGLDQFPTRLLQVATGDLAKLQTTMRGLAQAISILMIISSISLQGFLFYASQTLLQQVQRGSL